MSFSVFIFAILVSSFSFAQIEVPGAPSAPLPSSVSRDNSLGAKNNLGSNSLNADGAADPVLDAAALAERQKKFRPFASKFMGRKVQKPAEERLREVSNMYEKHFLRDMLKSMRSTVKEGGFVNTNQAEKIFREQLDEHYVDKWGEKGGIGLSDMIYKQLIEKFGAAMGMRAGVTRPKGPLSMDASGGNRVMPFKHPGKKGGMSYRIDSSASAAILDPSLGTQEIPASASRDVKAPWGGVLLGSRSLVDSQTMIEIEHDNGLKSQVVFKGVLSKVSTGQKLQAGDTVGFLSSEAKSLYWTVEQATTSGPQTVSE